MTEEEEQFQFSNTFWICEKLIENDDEKVRGHCRNTGKFRDAAHWGCNINLQLTKKVSVIFHNLKGYDNHLNFYELKSPDSFGSLPNFPHFSRYPETREILLNFQYSKIFFFS